MKKRFLSIFMALSMGLTTVPVTAWAADTDWTDYVVEEIEFTIADEDAPEWINRIAVPEFAKDFYDMLVEASDGDGDADYLMDAKYYDLGQAEGMDDEPIWVLDVDETECIIGLEAAKLTFVDGITEEQRELVQNNMHNYIKAAYSAFDADHPEVFWLYRFVPFSGVYTGENKYAVTMDLAIYEEVAESTWETTFQKRAEHLLNGEDKLFIDGDFINDEDISDMDEIAGWPEARAREIMDAFPENASGFKAHLRNNGLLSEADTSLDTVAFDDLTDAGKIAYFDYWLIAHNDYNPDEPNEEETSFGGSLDAVSARECISAMTGKTGNKGPVCAGFARAMKVLCDAAGIGCVIVESIPAECHTWNYVQVDNGDWFGLDTTWNEAEGDHVADYLFANKSLMAEGHTVKNDGWGEIVFPDTPEIQENSFAFAPGWLVDEDAAAERITEIKEVKIDGIVSPVLGETPVTTGFTVVTENVSITKDGEGVDIPITWTDKNGTVVEGAFVANTVYKANFVIEPASGYTFGDTKVTINGAPAGTKAEVDASDGTVTVTFPATEDDAPAVTPSRGGGSSSPKYKVSVNKDSVENGSVEFSSSKAKKGSTVKITVTPDEGYMLDELHVLDKDGNELELKDLGNGVYSFKMPKGGVEVDATFEEISEDNSVADNKETGTLVLTIGQAVYQKDGEYLVNDVAPIIQGERTFLPIRMIAEALGATVTWNDAEQSVTITDDDTTIIIYIGQAFALVNGEPVQLDVSAFIQNGRTYLPVRFVAESLDADVNWDQNTQQVTIAY